MASGADILKEFLVSVRYQVERGSEEGMTRGLKAMGTRVLALGISFRTLQGVVERFIHTAEGMERLWFASTRTGATVGNIQAIGFALRQMGSSAEGAQSAIESIARFMRLPNAGAFFGKLGVATTDANGRLRDTGAILTDLGRSLAAMPMYRAQAYAEMFGMDDRTLIALRQGTGQYSALYQQMQGAAGLNPQAAAAGSHAMMTEVRNLGAAFDILRQKVIQNVAGPITSSIARFREGFVANFNIVGRIITAVAKAVVGFGAGLAQLAGRTMEIFRDLSDTWNHLDPTSKIAIEALGGVLIAWRLLNAGILATPLGMLAAAVAALLLLYDDYRSFKEGSQHLLPWEQWEPEIQKVKGLFGGVGAAFGDLMKAGRDLWAQLGPALEPIAEFAQKSLKDLLILNLHILEDTLRGITDLLRGDWKAAWGEAKNIAGEVMTYIRDKIASLVGMLPKWLSDKIGFSDEKKAEFSQLTDALTPSAGYWAEKAKEFGAVFRYLGGGGAKSAPGQADALSRAAMAFFTSDAGGHYSTSQAAGLVANLQQESGLDPRAQNGLSYGIGQWDPERRRAIEEHFGKRLEDMSLGEQFRAISWELSPEGPEHAAGDRLRGTTGDQQSGETVSRYFERPKLVDFEASRRGAAAVQLHQNIEINISGNGDPAAIGQAMDRANENLMRNVRAQVS